MYAALAGGERAALSQRGTSFRRWGQRLVRMRFLRGMAELAQWREMLSERSLALWKDRWTGHAILPGQRSI